MEHLSSGADKLFRLKAVRIARTWLGTPYRHQASTKGAGADCLGLIRGIWRELYGYEPEIPPPYTSSWGEYNHTEPLLNAARRNMREIPISKIDAGDILLFRMKTNTPAKHLAIFTENTGFEQTMIHAYSGSSAIETYLSTPWLSRLTSAFRLPRGNQ